MNIDSRTGIIYRRWRALSPRAILLLVHGIGAHTGRWEFLADFFLRRNITSYAVELRGFGRTDGIKGHISSFNIYYSDIARMRDIIKAEEPERKIFLLGESVGGVISFLLAARRPRLFDGLICISPAFLARLKSGPMDYIKALAPVLYNPKKEILLPFTSAMCTRDAEYARAMDNDEREHRYATSKFLYNLAIAQKRAAFFRNEIKIPVLFILAGRDEIVYPEASKKVFDRLAAADKEIIEYKDMYHALTIDLDRERVFEDLFRWIEKRSL